MKRSLGLLPTSQRTLKGRKVMLIWDKASIASKAAGLIRVAGNFINTALQRATQRTQRFIRWVRVWIYKQAPWGDSLARRRKSDAA